MSHRTPSALVRTARHLLIGGARHLCKATLSPAGLPLSALSFPRPVFSAKRGPGFFWVKQ